MADVMKTKALKTVIDSLPLDADQREIAERVVANASDEKANRMQALFDTVRQGLPAAHAQLDRAERRDREASQPNPVQRRRVLQGTVVSDKGGKTVIVLVERRVMHPVYQKFIRQSKKYAAHDEGRQSKVGDSVSIIECNPMANRGVNVSREKWEIMTDIAVASSNK